MDSAKAHTFFDQLTEFSRRVFKKMGLPEDGSPWGMATLGRPKGGILHYTADDDMQRVLRWFCLPGMSAKASAHVVIGDRKYDWAEGLDTDLDLVHALPVTVVQCRPVTATAWHATWTNPTAYSIENINMGEVRRNRSNQYVWWASDWTAVWHTDKTPQAMYGRIWEPYTLGQALANVAVMIAVNAYHDGSLLRGWLVGHDCVQGIHTPGALNHDKRDLGPTFPIHEVRQAIFGDKPLEAVSQTFLHPEYGTVWRTQLAQDALAVLGRNAGADPWLTYAQTVRTLSTSPAPRTLAKSILKALGYYIGDTTTAEMNPDEVTGIYLFQRMAGLTADGQLGPNTYQALSARFADRFGGA